MSLELLDAHPTAGGITLTFATQLGVQTLTGSCEEVARLARAMQQVSALASASDSASVWLEDVVVGDAVVKLGLKPGGQARLRIDRGEGP